jgi:hypothetical protein
MIGPFFLLLLKPLSPIGEHQIFSEMPLRCMDSQTPEKNESPRRKRTGYSKDHNKNN